MERYLDSGGTLLLCSHSMYHVQKLCQRALWLKDGRPVREGASAPVTQAYLAYHEEKSQGAKAPMSGAAASAAGVYAIQSLTLDPGETAAQGASVTVRGEVYSPDGRAPVVLIGIVRADGTPVYGVATDMDQVAPTRIGDDRFAFDLSFAALPLLPGKYFIRAHALDPEGVRLFDNVERELTITGTTRELGMVRLAHHWNGGEGTGR
jgi:lipopolysaccharide transport system ATP-binding protein